MSTRGWSGRPPKSPEEAKARLMDAAIACLQRFGVEKTGVGDIASLAGVTKPTLYAYFDGRDELLHAALTRAGEAFGARIVAHARRFHRPADRIVEAMLFALREIPNEPGIAITTSLSSGGFDARIALSPVSFGVARRSLEQILDRPSLDATELDEIAEAGVRWMLSLLVYPGDAGRHEDGLRAFLHRRMIPGLGLGADEAER